MRCVSLQLAARIAVSNLHKNTLKSFSDTCVRLLVSASDAAWRLTRRGVRIGSRSVKQLYEYTNPRNDQWAPLVSEELHAVVLKARSCAARCATIVSACSRPSV